MSTLFPNMQPDQNAQQPVLTYEQVKQLLLDYENGESDNILDYRWVVYSGRFLTPHEIEYVRHTAEGLVRFMDEKMMVPFNEQPTQLQLLAMVDSEGFFSAEEFTPINPEDDPLNKILAVYRRNHATDSDYRTSQGFTDPGTGVWDAYRYVMCNETRNS